MSFMFSVPFLCQRDRVKEDDAKTTEWVSAKVNAGIKHGQSKKKILLDQRQKSCTSDILIQIYNDVPIIIKRVIV